MISLYTYSLKMQFTLVNSVSSAANMNSKWYQRNQTIGTLSVKVADKNVLFQYINCPPSSSLRFQRPLFINKRNLRYKFTRRQMNANFNNLKFHKTFRNLITWHKKKSQLMLRAGIFSVWSSAVSNQNPP